MIDKLCSDSTNWHILLKVTQTATRYILKRKYFIPCLSNLIKHLASHLYPILCNALPSYLKHPLTTSSTFLFHNNRNLLILLQIYPLTEKKLFYIPKLCPWLQPLTYLSTTILMVFISNVDIMNINLSFSSLSMSFHCLKNII